MQKRRKSVFEEHLFGSAWWATLYPDGDLIKKNFVAQADLAIPGDRQTMGRAFDEGKGRHELTLFNNKRQSIATAFTKQLLSLLQCPPLPKDPPPAYEVIAIRAAKLERAKQGTKCSKTDLSQPLLRR